MTSVAFRLLLQPSTEVLGQHGKAHHGMGVHEHGPPCVPRDGIPSMQELHDEVSRNVVLPDDTPRAFLDFPKCENQL